MKDLKKKETFAKEIISTGSNFGGYTLEEIRFQRALTAMEAEFCKTKFIKSWNLIQKSNPLLPSNTNSPLPMKAGNIALKLLNGLNYLDYALLGLSLFRGSKKVFSFFRRGKKR